MRSAWIIAVCLIAAAAAVGSLAEVWRVPKFGGTFIGAVVAEDGIVMGADSRSTFLDTDGRHLGFVDGMQKLYATNTTAVAVSGLTSVEGELFNSFVDRNAFLLQRPADEVLFGFAVWLPYNNATGVLLLSGGFPKGKPTICGRSVVRPQACQDNGFITNKRSPSLETWFSGLHAAPKATAAAAALRKAIQESAASDETVGGATSLVQLQAGGALVWLENPPRQNQWKTVCDIIRDARTGRVRIAPSGGNQADLDRFLGRTCPK